MEIEKAIQTIDLKQLMKKEKKIIFLHQKKPYQLAITRRGKLILTAAESK